MSSGSVESLLVVNTKGFDTLKPYQAIDGQAGAWVEGGKYFVTSPYSFTLYRPLVGPREVFIRQDYRLGAEDPILYPQPFIHDRCHWAAIPRRPSNPENPLTKWWDALPPEAFVQEVDGAVKGLGRWSKEHLLPYERDCNLLCERVSNYRSSLESPRQINTLITALNGQLERSLRHLATMPLPLHRSRQLWSFFQRWYLELLGALDWVEIYLPIMNGCSQSTELSRANAAVTMGAFLTAVKDCEFFFKANLPFWLVRSSEHHATTRVDYQVEPLTPETTNICLDEIMSHKKEVIYHGQLRDLERAVAVETFGMSIVNYTNDPFNVPATENSLKPSSTPSSSVGSSRNHSKRQRHERYEPCRTCCLCQSEYAYDVFADARGKAKANPQPHVERNKFAEIRGPCSPDIPDIWVEALASIDKTRRPTKQEVVNGGYAFPDPGMILYPPREKRERLLRNWLRFRDVLIFCTCMKPCLASSAWSAKQWRIFLGTTDDHVAKSGTPMAQQRETVQELLGQCLEFYGLSLRKNDSHFFTWNGERYEIGQLSETRLVKEIVWELFELNFRFELYALDRALHQIGHASYGVGDNTTFNPEVQSCFPTGVVAPTEVSLENASHGLAAAKLRDREQYFRQLCHVMKQWPGGAYADRFLSKRTFSDNEVEEMEGWATRFYCQEFYNKFGRPPILPHRID
ncbi:hypothetical protein AAF712_010350 [Marasmius tenuissimus]|uniref:Uncharacterized protein n=1 Tax=Marasmius tenuissimus TaxID=585030 RepID=A0ABR2ZNS3_9AGAR